MPTDILPQFKKFIRLEEILVSDKNNSRVKKAIVILAILLAISLIALGAVLVYRHFSNSTPTFIQVPDNIITDSSSPSSDVSDVSSDIGGITSDISEPSSSDNSSSDYKTAPVISLNSSIYGDNLPFNVPNMFPGDMYVQHYCLRVSFQEKVTLNFETEIQRGYEKLAEAMYVRVRILGESVPLYDGPMGDMPVLEYKLLSSKETTRDVFFVVEPYLPTSTTNEYQNCALVADFHWYISEVENLKPYPPTGGDSESVFPWIFLAAFSLCGLIILYPQLRKEEKNAK